MISFISKSFPRLKHSLRTLHKHHELHYPQLKNRLLSSYSSKIAVKPTSRNGKFDSFSVNYFIKACGFSPEKAISASKYVNFNKPDKPDAVIAFLKKQGFSEAQVMKLIKNYPSVVLCDPEKTISPKIEFFMSKCTSKADVLEMLVAVPNIFVRSLDRTIIPSFNWLEKFLGSYGEGIDVIARCPRLSSGNLNNMVSNIESLQKAGVPKARIRSALAHLPQSFIWRPGTFTKAVEEVKEMGVDPLKSTFVVAVHVKLGLSKSSWDNKIEHFRKWGCSEDEVLVAFVTYPWLMVVSDDKIEGIMRYFVNEMSWNPSELLQKAGILLYSLNKRIIPRCSVYQVLVSKGSIKNLPSVHSLLKYQEEMFRRCLERYENEAPEIWKLYQEKLKLQR